MSESPSGCELIAEAGVNHNGREDLARALVEAAAASGADCVKFQTFDPEELTVASAPTADYQARAGAGSSQKAMLETLVLPADALRRVARAAEDAGIAFLSTPFDLASARFLVEDLGMARIKVGSGELTNLPLLLGLARLGRPILLSTGMGTLEEVRRALGVIAFARLADPSEPPSLTAFEVAFQSPEAAPVLAQTVVMQCTTQYPAPHDQANLRVLDAYAGLGVQPGYSDHTSGVDIALAAVARGARVIEKHLTLSRDMEGPDHKASLEPAEMATLVRGIRRVVEALGSPVKRPQPAEIPNMSVARRVLVAARPIRAGEAFTEENMTAKRAGAGIAPDQYWSLLGGIAATDFAVDEPIRT